LKVIDNIEYKVKLKWVGGTASQVNFDHHPPFMVDIPKIFGGEGKHYCSDEIFLASIGGCFLATFLYYMDKLKFEIKGINVSVSTNLKLKRDGYHITGVNLNVNIQVEDKFKEKAERCANLAAEYCHILRHIKEAVPVTLNLTVYE